MIQIDAGAAKSAFDALTEDEKRTMISALKLLSVMSISVILSDRDKNASATLVAIRTFERLVNQNVAVNHALVDKLVVLCEAAQLDAKVMA